MAYWIYGTSPLAAENVARALLKFVEDNTGNNTGNDRVHLPVTWTLSGYDEVTASPTFLLLSFSPLLFFSSPFSFSLGLWDQPSFHNGHMRSHSKPSAVYFITSVILTNSSYDRSSSGSTSAASALLVRVNATTAAAASSMQVSYLVRTIDKHPLPVKLDSQSTEKKEMKNKLEQ